MALQHAENATGDGGGDGDGGEGAVASSPPPLTTMSRQPDETDVEEAAAAAAAALATSSPPPPRSLAWTVLTSVLTLLSSTRIYIALFLAQIMWSLLQVFLKLLLQSLPVQVIPLLRSSLSIPCFVAYAYQQDRQFWHSLTRRDIALLAFEGFLGNFMHQQLFTLGVKYITAGDGGMLQPAIPIFTTIFAILLGRERFHISKLLGIVFSILGCAFIVLLESSDSSASSSSSSDSSDSSTSTSSSSSSLRVLGISLVLMQALCTSIYITIQKPMLTRMSVATFTCFMFVFGGGLNILVGLFFVGDADWADLPPVSWPIIFYNGVIGTFAAFSLFVYATSHLPASIASLAITMQPFFTPLFGWIILGESMTIGHAIGGLCICTGVAIVIWARQREVNQAAKAQAARVLAELQMADLRDHNSSSVVEGEDEVEKVTTVGGDGHGQGDDSGGKGGRASNVGLVASGGQVDDDETNDALRGSARESDAIARKLQHSLDARARVRRRPPRDHGDASYDRVANGSNGGDRDGNHGNGNVDDDDDDDPDDLLSSAASCTHFLDPSQPPLDPTAVGIGDGNAWPMLDDETSFVTSKSSTSTSNGGPARTAPIVATTTGTPSQSSLSR